jgi:uncharacterized lipoprotein YajG
MIRSGLAQANLILCEEQYNLNMLRKLTFLLLTFILLAGCGPKPTPIPVPVVTSTLVTDTPASPTLP